MLVCRNALRWFDMAVWLMPTIAVSSLTDLGLSIKAQQTIRRCGCEMVFSKAEASVALLIKSELAGLLGAFVGRVMSSLLFMCRV